MNDPIETEKQYIVDLLLDDFYKLTMVNVELNALKVVIPKPNLENDQNQNPLLIRAQQARVIQQLNLSKRLINKLKKGYSTQSELGQFLQEQFHKFDEILEYARQKEILSSEMLILNHKYSISDENYIQLDKPDQAQIQETKDHIFLETLRITYKNEPQLLRGGRQKTRPLLIDKDKFLELTQFRYQQVIDLAFEAYLQGKISNLLQYFDLEHNKQIYYYFYIVNQLQQDYYENFLIIDKDCQHIAELYDLIIRLDFFVYNCKNMIHVLKVYLESKNTIKIEKIKFTIIEVLMIKSCYAEIKSKYKGDTNFQEQDKSEKYIVVDKKEKINLK